MGATCVGDVGDVGARNRWGGGAWGGEARGEGGKGTEEEAFCAWVACRNRDPWASGVAARGTGEEETSSCARNPHPWASLGEGRARSRVGGAHRVTAPLQAGAHQTGAHQAGAHQAGARQLTAHQAEAPYRRQESQAPPQSNCPLPRASPESPHLGEPQPLDRSPGQYRDRSRGQSPGQSLDLSQGQFRGQSRAHHLPRRQGAPLPHLTLGPGPASRGQMTWCCRRRLHSRSRCTCLRTACGLSGARNKRKDSRR